MTKAEQALAIWQALPQQHAACLTVIYRADQDAEAEQRDAWTSGGRPERAAVWRWLPYRPGRTTTPPSENLAVQLRAHGLDHTQASSIFTALAEQRLVELRAASTARGQDVKLTTWGRKVARAGGIDPARADKDLLSEGLWQMLTQVWRAHPDGHLTGYSGAWDHLLDRTPDPYVRTESARDRRAMFLTDAGADHYRARWRSYARAYPDVDAPHPDNAQFWPPHIDQALTRLRTDCQTIRDLITTIPEAITDLTAPGAAAPPPEIDLPHLPAAAPPGTAATLDRLRRAADHTQSALDRAAARYTAAVRDALTGYTDILTDHTTTAHAPYRDACLRYTATATAVLNAVLTDHDPAQALHPQPPADLPWPWTPPAPPPTGLPDLDTQLRTAHQAATPPRRRRTTPEPDLLTCAAHLTDYADTITELLANGHLLRLLLRTTNTTTP